MEKFESTQRPEVLALSSAQEIINQRGLDLNVTIQNREARLAGTEEWKDAQVFHFSLGSNPSIEWTMDINTDPEYLQNTLPEIIAEAYQEKTSGAA